MVEFRTKAVIACSTSGTDRKKVGQERLSRIAAFVLVGGLGTRLRSVISHMPKPMAPVAGIPFVELLVESLVAKGLRRLVLLTGYMGEIIESHFATWNREGVSIAFSREESPLGTGGPVKLAEPYATDPTLLVNGDTFFDADIEEILCFHERKLPLVTLSLHRVADVSRYGSVTVTEDGFITGFREKKEGPGGPGLINAGVSLISLDFIRGLPTGRPFSMERDLFPKLAGSDDMVGLCQDKDFFDIGTPESYEEFQVFVRRWRDMPNRA